MPISGALLTQRARAFQMQALAFQTGILYSRPSFGTIHRHWLRARRDSERQRSPCMMVISSRDRLTVSKTGILTTFLDIKLADSTGRQTRY